MRITFLLPVVGWSGGIRVAAIYARWLADRGHHVTLVSQAAKAPTWRQQLKNILKGKGWIKHQPVPTSYLDGLGLEHKVVPAGRIPGPADVPPGDVLISTWWETAEWAYHLPDDRGARAYFVQGHEVFDYLPRLRCEATYRLPFHKIVIAQWLADVMANQYGDAGVDLVSNAVDHSLFHAAVRGKQRQPTVGFLYHEASFKGTDIALSVVRLLGVRYPELKVVVFGSKPPGGIHSLPDFADFHMAPPQENLRQLYATCDVWLTTSRTEGFNLMAMEAMACRTPVVSTRTGWPIEGIEDGVNGYLVNIDDVDAAVEAVARVLNLDDQSWRFMSANAFATVAHSTWEVSCQKFEKALYHACERSRKGEIQGKPSQAVVC
ncbi:glycosyltransferase family 4 protein [Aquabacterium sp. A08]|uniref:glycosyltransferase family 4 protein n=1 Tax=Aquabacterium sp. A08 TaxID=2718532 RepID=UPI00141F2589|nr:glycosyltransferase family 4 protein [Aquabacterium sp. A08]NIC41035.1 glycosyltransferase family 4 protein [Aquabacterium sp. A08]